MGIARLVAYRGTIVEQVLYLFFEVLRFGFEGADPALQQRFGLA
jgi:hypothetical protein